MLQMVVHLVFHVEDDALGDPGVDIALENADDLREGQREEGHEQELHEQLHVPADQRLVHDAARDDRGQQAHGGGQDDGNQHQQKLEPVGPEIGQDAKDQALCHLRHVLFLFLGEELDRPARARSGSHENTSVDVYIFTTQIVIEL